MNRHESTSALKTTVLRHRRPWAVMLAVGLALLGVATVWAAVGPVYLALNLNQAAGATSSAFPLAAVPANPRSVAAQIVTIGDTAYFAADDGIHGRELWKSDGTLSGTVMVADIHTGAGDSNPPWLTVFSGALYFVADDGIHGSELW